MTYTFRLKTGSDLKLGIEQFFKDNNLNSAAIVTCVGSLSAVNIRMAGAEPNKQDIRNIKGDYEIVSLVGTVSKDGSHIHVSVSDKGGRVLGGHLKEGSTVHTTAEIVILESDKETYIRELDENTGFTELVVQK